MNSKIKLFCIIMSMAILFMTLPSTGMIALAEEIVTNPVRHLVVRNADFTEPDPDTEEWFSIPGWGVKTGRLGANGILRNATYLGYDDLCSFFMGRGADANVSVAYSDGILGVREGYSYTAEAFVYGVGNVSLYIGYYNIQGLECAEPQRASIEMIDGQWQKLSVTTTAPMGTAFARILIGFSDVGKGSDYIYADNVQMWENPLLKTSTPTDGYGWAEGNGALYSDPNQCEFGIEYVISGECVSDGELALSFFDKEGELVNTVSKSAVSGEIIYVRAYAPVNADKVKVCCTTDSFKNVELSPAHTGTQVPDGSFESLGTENGSTWSTVSLENATLLSDDFEGYSVGSAGTLYANAFDKTSTAEDFPCYNDYTEASIEAEGENYFLRMYKPTAKNAAGVTTPMVSASQGDVISFSFDYISDGNVFLYVREFDENGNTLVQDLYKTLLASDDWTSSTSAYQIKNASTKYFAVMVYFGTSGVGDTLATAYFDNFLFTCSEKTDIGGWTSHNSAVSGTPKIVNSDSKSGTNAMILEGASGARNGLRTPLIPATAGTAYDISGQYKINESRGLYLYIEFWPENPVTDAGGNKLTSSIGPLSFPASAEWRTASTSVVAPEGTKYISAMFYGTIDTLMIDDVSIICPDLTELSGCEAYSTDEFKTDGSYGVAIQNQEILSSYIPVLSGKSYAVSVDAKCSIGNCATMKLSYYTNDNSLLDEVTATATGTGNTEKLVINTTAPMYAENVRISLIGKSEKAYFDNVEMYAVSNTVSNASFEDLSGYNKVGTFPVQWRTDKDVMAAPIGVLELENLTSSATALEIKGATGGSVYSSMIKAEGNTDYTARILASSERGGSLRIAFFDDNFKLLAASEKTDFSGTDWSKYTACATAPAGTAYASLELVAEKDAKFYAESAEFGETVLDFGSNTQMFIDDFVTADLENITKTLHEGVKTEPILDKSSGNEWEKNGTYVYGTVFYDEEEEIYKMWYQATNADYVGGGDAASAMACYATSTDGINWDKPNLGIISYNGSTDNNMIGNFHIQSVFKDMKETDASKRYKMITYHHTGSYLWLYSPDGIRWTEGGHVLSGGTDVITAAYDKSTNKYYAVAKALTYHLTGNARYKRNFYTMTSENPDDITSWNTPVPANSLADVLDHKYTYRTDSYGMGLYQKDGNYIGFNWLFNIPGISDGEGTIDLRLAYSRDLTEEWQRPAREAILPLGEAGSVDDSMIFTISDAIEVGDEVWVYCGGWDNDHAIAQRDGVIYIAKWRMDGFVSADAGEAEGTITTKPFTFSGNELKLNANAEGGQILVELVDKNGSPIEGFTKEDCDAITSDSVKHTVSWNGKTDLSALCEEEISMKLYATNSEIYSFKFNQCDDYHTSIGFDTENRPFVSIKGDSKQSYTVVLATYGNDDKLEASEVLETCTLEKGEIFDKKYEAVSLKEGYTAKLFLWDSLSGMSPYTEFEILE